MLITLTTEWTKLDDFMTVSADTKYQLQPRSAMIVANSATEPSMEDGYYIDSGKNLVYEKTDGKYCWLKSTDGTKVYCEEIG